MTNHRDLSVFNRRNLVWLALFLILSTGIFLLWSGLAVEETNIFVMLDPGEISEGLTTSDLLVKGLDVRVRGPKSAIQKLSGLKLRYPLDLSGVKLGINTISIDPDRIPISKAVSIIKINPSFLTVKVDNEIRKEVPVVISFFGKPAPGFFLADAIAKPSSIILRGPESVLGPIKKISTKPIVVEGLSESFKKEIALDLAEDLDIVSSSKIILSEIFIEETVVTRRFDGLIVEGKETPYTYSITPSAISIEVKGPLNIIENLQAENVIQVYVDLKGLKPGVYVRRATIPLPVNAMLVSAKPEIFTVTLNSQLQNSKNGNQKKE